MPTPGRSWAEALARRSSPFGWSAGRCRRRAVSSFQVSVSVRPDRRSEPGAAGDAGHHSRFVPLLHRWPPRHAVWPPRSLPVGRRFLGLSPDVIAPGLRAGAVQIACFGARRTHPACGGVARTGRPVLAAGSATPSLGVVTCASLGQPIDGWCISRVVTTGWRRAVTTRLAQRIAATGAGGPPCLGAGTGACRVLARRDERDVDLRPRGRRLAEDEAGLGARGCGLGDALTGINRADSASVETLEQL